MGFWRCSATAAPGPHNCFGNEKKNMSRKQPKKSRRRLKKLKPVENLSTLFGRDEEADFAGIFEEISAAELQKALHEKKEAAFIGGVRPLNERLRTYPRPEAELDLHGLTADAAEKKAESFLRNSRDKGLHTVRIITGKGLHSPQGRAVLPDVAEALIRRLRNEKIVLASQWEGKSITESGSMIIYLTK